MVISLFSYALQTAVHLFNKRFELQEYKTLWPVREFKFADSSTDAKLTIHMERDEPRLSNWVIGLQSARCVSPIGEELCHYI